MFFGLTLLLCVFIRIRLSDLPLERDEGEYATAAQILLRGGVPYLDVYNMKFPGVYYFYALAFSLFGQSVIVIRALLIFVNLVSTFWIIKIARQLGDKDMAWLAGSFYLLLSMGRNGQGMIANTEHFVVAFALGGVYWMLKSLRQPNPNYFLLVLSGVCLSFGVLMKQHGSLFVVFAALYATLRLWGQDRFKTLFRSLASMALGCAIPFAIFLTYLTYKGAFHGFLFYAIEYASAYSNNNHFFWGIRKINAIQFLWEDNILLWVLFFVGLISLFNVSKHIPNRYFLLLFCICTLMATIPGYYFRPHYFQLFLPSVSLIAAWFLYYIAPKIQSPSISSKSFHFPLSIIHYPLFQILALLSFSIPNISLIEGHRTKVIEHLYSDLTFSRCREIGEYLHDHTSSKDTIGIYGAEPEIFFYAQRPPASGYMYHYPLLEPQPFAQRMTLQYIQETEHHHPEIFIHSRISEEDNNPETSELLHQWMENFEKKDYTPIGVLTDNQAPAIIWFTKGETIDPNTKPLVAIFKKNKMK